MTKGVSKLLAGRIPMSALVQTLAVAEHLSFRHAANALGVAQSSVSARIRALEEDLGILLFERHARGVRLTEAGCHFVDRIAESIDQINHAVRTANMVASGEYGHVRLGVSALIAGSFLAELLGAYREQRPAVSLDITEGTARDGIIKLRTNRLDVVMLAGTPKIPDCRSAYMWSERLLAALPIHHPLAKRPGIVWADLMDETFLVRHGGTGPQAYDHIVQRLGDRCPNLSVLRFDVERTTLLSMIAQDYGVTVVSEATTLMCSPGVTFLPILDEPKPIAFSAVWSPHNRCPLLRDLLGLAARMWRSRSSLETPVYYAGQDTSMARTRPICRR